MSASSRSPFDPVNPEERTAVVPVVLAAAAEPAPRTSREPYSRSTRFERLAINQLTTLRGEFQSDLAEYSRAGIPAIGLSWRKLCDFGVQRGIRSVLRSGLAVSSIGWVGGFTGHHGYSLDETLRDAKRAIRVAAQLRAPNVVVITGPQGGHITPHARRLVVASLRELANFAGRYGVNVSLKPMEPMYRGEWTFIHSFRDACDLLDIVNHPRVKLAFGTYHHWREEGVQDLLRTHAERISLVQLADWKAPRDENDQLLPCTGAIPLRNLLHSLDAGGYSGWLEIEVWSRDLWKLPTADLIQSCLAGVKNLFHD